MIQPVTRERWQEAQIAEAQTDYRAEDRIRWDETFRYLGMSFDQEGKTICEVGCGPYPALALCENVNPIIVEPIQYPELNEWAMRIGPRWYPMGIEDVLELPKADEVWLFNLMQHVRNPEMVVALSKAIAPTIRFFEPVDYPTSLCHPHLFTQQDFERWFGDSVKRYTDRVPGFFDADCVYGTWRAADA